MKYDIREKDTISSEGNTDICFSVISWNKREYKNDIRKWMKKDEDIIPLKGITLSDDELNKMVEYLVNKGYGNSKTLISSINNRKEKTKLFTVVKRNKHTISTNDILKSIRKDD